jgi:CDP-diacylglycerol---serine O-phosphatidyltransferase
VFFALLIAYPWAVLTIGTVLYLVCLPFGWLSHRDYTRREAAARAQGQSAEPHDKPAEPAGDVSAPSSGLAAIVPFERGGERPPRR